MTKGVLSGWHNLSTNGTLNVNGVSVQDILSILKTIKSDERFIAWREVLDDMYAHVVNQNNPHHVTTDQLATTVIQLIYEAWLLEGYSGELQYFIDLLFRYIEFADDTIMNEGVSEIHVPTVDVLTRYIEQHNTNPNAHDDRINPYFLGDCNITDPSYSVRQLIGVTDEENLLLNAESTHYEKVMLHDGWAVKEMTFVLSFKFQEGTIFQFENANGTVVLRITAQPSEGRILFTRCVSNNLNVPINSTINDNLLTLPNVTLDHVGIPYSGISAKCAIVLDGSSVKYCLFQRSFDTEMNTNPQLIEFDLNGIPTFVELGTIPVPFKNPRISFARMEKGDILTDLIYYPQALTFNQLIFVYEWLGDNIREEVGGSYPPPEVVVIPTDPEDPEEPIVTKPTVFLLSGTSGLLNSRSNDGLTSVDEKDNLTTDIVSAVRTESSIVVVNEDGQLFIKRDGDEDFSQIFSVRYNEESVFVNKMYLFEDILCFLCVTNAETYAIITTPSDLFEDNFHVVLDTHVGLHDMAAGVMSSWPGPKKYVVVAADGGRLYYQQIAALKEGEEFNSDFVEPSPGGDWDILCIAFGNNRFVFAGTNGTVGTWEEQYLDECLPPVIVGIQTWTQVIFQDPFFVLIAEDGTSVKSIIPTYPTEEDESYYLTQWGPVIPAPAPALVINEAIADHDVCALTDISGKLILSRDALSWDTPIQISDTESLTGIYSRNIELVRKNFVFVSEQSKIGRTDRLADVEMINARTQHEWEFLVPGNDGNWVAASRFGKIAYTLDLADWNESDNFIPGTCKFCNFINGQFIYFNSNGDLYTSPTGKTWTLLTHIDDYEEYPWVYYLTRFASNGTNKHVIVHMNHVYYSTDLITWTKLYLSTDVWQSIAYHAPIDKFVIMSTNGKCKTSQDMSTWSASVTVNASDSFTSVCSNGEFLAAYGSWRNRIYQSYDGSYWWSSFIDEGNFQGSFLTWNDDKFIVVDAYSTSSTSRMSHSGDWTTVHYDDFITDWDDSLVDIKYYNGMYYILTNIGNIYKYDGTAPMWEFIDVAELPAEWKRVNAQRTYGEYNQYSEFLITGLKGFFGYLNSDGSMDALGVTSEVHDWTAGMFCKLQDIYEYRRWVMISSDGTVAIAVPIEDADYAEFTTYYPYTDFPGIDCATNSDIDNPRNLIISSNGKCLWFNGEFSGEPEVFTTKTPIKILYSNQFYVLTSDGFILRTTDENEWAAPVNTGCPNVIDFVIVGDKIFVLGEGNQLVIGNLSDNTWADPITINLPSNSAWNGITQWHDHVVLYSTSGYLAMSMTAEYWREWSYPDSVVNFMHAIGVTNPYESSDGGGEAPV